LRLLDSDDYITTDSCVFVITEKKPTDRLKLTSYLNETDIPRVTSNLYLNSNQLFGILQKYQTNDYGKWTSNSNNGDIIYNQGRVGLGVSTPNYYLDVNGTFNCHELFRNGISISNTLNEYINISNIKNVFNNNVIGYNTTLVDVDVRTTYETYIVDSDEFTDTHRCYYTKYFEDSELIIQVEFPYVINGFGTDSYASRLAITSELEDYPHFSIEHSQVFIGYGAGGGTRSATLSPISIKTNITGKNILIRLQLRLIDSDDYIYTDKCVFIITEKKARENLIFTNYINDRDIPRLTSNLYISPSQLASNLLSYQTNDYGKWTSNINNSSIFYNNGNVGIGTIAPNDKLHVAGNIITNGSVISSFSDIRLKTIIEPLDNSLEIISKLNGFKYINNDLAYNIGFTDNKEQVGLNAQEVGNYIPEVVTIAPFDIDIDDNGEITSKSGNNYLTVQYEKLIPYLIESIKELKKENERLNNRLKKLENSINK